MSRIRLVTFDLDDTLYPEIDYVRVGFRAVARYLVDEGLTDEPLAEAFSAAFDRGVRGRIFDDVLAEAGIALSPALIRELVRVYRTGRAGDRSYPLDITLAADATRAIERLRDDGIKLALISDGPLEAQQAKVEALGLQERLEAIILTDALGREFWKPHPRAFREVAEALGVASAEAVYVADNPGKDFDGPAVAGWAPSVRLRRPDGLYRSVALKPGARVAATIGTLDDLAGVLANI